MAGLKRVIPEGMSIDDFMRKRAGEVPDFDPEMHKQLIANAGSTPMWLSAREILSSHRLLEGEGNRPDVMYHKANESFQTNHSTINIGTGRGTNLADNISSKGYDWSKAIPLGAKGVDYGTAYEVPDRIDRGPIVTQGHHRLAYMWTFHPDEPIPVDIRNYQRIWEPHETSAINQTFGGTSESEALTTMRERQKENIKQMYRIDPEIAAERLDDRE